MRTSEIRRLLVSRWLPVLLTAALLTPALACTEAQKEQMAANTEARKRQMAERQLEERANEYWNLMRWQSWDQAATYLEDEEQQLSFLRARTATGTAAPSIRDIEIEYVFVGTGAEEGEIRLSWTEVAATEARVSDRNATQRWYKHHGKWWVDPEAPLGAAPESAVNDESVAEEEPPSDLPTETPR